MIDDDIAAMSLEEHIEERVYAAILAERQRCADVAKSVWKEAQASEQFDTVKAVSRIRCRI
ncbi:hypothetical protein NJB93_21310, partial [Brucella intermedia]|uniref:hypothetical protein n=1 Tax=Brucella intermedia TaxID=94625 RepID=UPI00209A6891